MSAFSALLPMYIFPMIHDKSSIQNRKNVSSQDTHLNRRGKNATTHLRAKLEQVKTQSSTSLHPSTHETQPRPRFHLTRNPTKWSQKTKIGSHACSKKAGLRHGLEDHGSPRVTKAYFDRVRNSIKGRPRCPGTKNQSTTRRISPSTVSSKFQTDGAKKALESANEKLRRSTREKNPVSRYNYKDYMAYHYNFMMKVISVREQETLSEAVKDP